MSFRPSGGSAPAAAKRRDPYVDVPTRSLSNVKYNKAKRFIEMGRNTNRRQLFNLSQAKSYMQTMLVASGAKRLIEQGKTGSIRQMFYMLKHTIPGTREETFNDQDEQLVFGEAAPGWPTIWRQARLYSAVDYVQADRVRRLVMGEFDRLFEKVDVLCGPLYGESIALVAATNFTGHPGVTFRAGFTESPTRSLHGSALDAAGPRVRITQNIAMHGRLFEEGSMLALASALEQKLGVWREGPPLG